MSARRRSRVELHLESCRSEEEIFQALIDQLGLLDLYRRNWFGMQEHFFYDPAGALPDTLVVYGLASLSRLIPEAADELEKCFQVRRDEEPSFTVTYSTDV